MTLSSHAIHDLIISFAFVLGAVFNEDPECYILPRNIELVYYDIFHNSRKYCRFDPPEIPKGFVPQHKFPAPLEIGSKSADAPPPEVPPPENNNLKVLIEGVATLVARCGKLFEDLSREKHRSNPLFAFLHGGDGCDFYARKLWEECQKRGNQTKLWEGKMFQNSHKMSAESRGKVLGEKALQKSTEDSSSMIASADAVNLQFNLSDTFIKPASFVSGSYSGSFMGLNG